jgi:VWFA-related protein
MRKLNRAVLTFLLCASAWAGAQQVVPQDPALTHRLPPAPVTAEQRLIQLDVVVTDDKGKPVSGLTQQDFALFDNKLPRPILAFHAYDGAAQKPDPPVHVILVLDTVNANFNEVAFVRQSMERFFAQNGGQLANPLSIFLFDDEGVHAQQQPSMDGNALGAALDQIENRLRTIGRATGDVGAIERFEMC